jgi:hypothetical protein
MEEAMSSHAATIRPFLTTDRMFYAAERQEAVAALDALLAENQRLRDWGQQVHDALDGRELPPHPDEAPARIQRLRDGWDRVDWYVRCLEDVQDGRGRVVRGLGEAKAGYDSARREALAGDAE